jgi:PAS domain S-box-containing protein
MIKGYPEREYPASEYSASGNERGAKYATLIKSLRKAEKIFLDAQGIIAGVHPDSATITGYKDVELIGKKFAYLCPPEERMIPLEAGSTTAAVEPRTATRFLMKKNHVPFWAKIRYQGVFSQGRLIGYQVAIQDATHSYLSTFRLSKLKKLYSGLFDNPFVGVIRVSMRDHSFLSLNTTARKMIHAPHKRFDDIFHHPDDLQKVMKALRQSHKAEFEMEFRERKKWFMVSLRLVSGSTYADGVMVDITDIKKKDGKLIRLTHELDQFIYHTSHELRAPLTSILGLTNLIRMEKDPAVIPGYVSMIENRVHTLDNLLRKMVTLVHRKKHGHDAIDWEALTLEMLNDCWPKKSSLRLLYEVNQSDPFLADATSVKLIFYHLISNALKYYNPDCDDPYLTIRITSSPREAVIRFSDNGIGIDADSTGNLFEIFYKAHADSNGHGLGLYIVKTMVDNLDGTIEVDTEAGKGSTFTITIPNQSTHRKQPE